MRNGWKLVAVPLLLVAWDSAHAVPCLTAGTGVTPPGGCLDGAGPNDSELAVSGFFMETGWDLINKTDEGVEAALWSGDFIGPSGHFELVANFWSMFSKAMVVLKGGLTEPSGVKWSAYLLMPGTLSHHWIYSIPAQDISYLSLYVIPSTTAVPEPGSLGLLGLGLVVLGLLRRDRID